LMLEKLGAILELTRPHNLIVAMLGVLAGYFAASTAYGENELSTDPGLATVMLIVALIAAAGYIINDYYDLESDSISKPWRPLPSGRISLKEARTLAYAFFAGGVASALGLGLLILAFVLVNACLVHEYSRWIKRSGLLGNMVVALNSSATILIGSLYKAVEEAAPLPLASLIPAIIAYSLVFGREIVKGVEDYHGDKKQCYMTLAVTRGPVRASKLASIVLSATILLAPIPLLYGQYGVVYLVLSSTTIALIVHAIYMLTRASTVEEAIEIARRTRSTLKVAFLTGVMGFLLDPLYSIAI